MGTRQEEAVLESLVQMEPSIPSSLNKETRIATILVIRNRLTPTRFPSSLIKILDEKIFERRGKPINFKISFN